MEDSLGNIWIATWQGGLNLFDRKKEKFTHFRNEPGNKTTLASEDIKCLYFDREGNSWLGTGNEGLDLYDPKTNKFIHLFIKKMM